MKKSKRPVSIFDRVISNQIENELYDDKPIPRQSYHEAQDYFLKNNQTNYAIPNDFIALLPLHWRRYAYRIDFELLFAVEEEAILDIPKLTDDSKTKLKSIVFGELPKEDLQE